jgi:tRNA threonylcarbamoyladenosine modification (KEOPS) complex  Pcc1 subunit
MWLQICRGSLHAYNENRPGFHKSPNKDLKTPARRLFLKPRLNKAEAEIQIEATHDTINVLIESLKPELEQILSDRSSISLESNEKCIVIKIIAEDVVALRAAVNSYLYWIQGILDISSRII